MSTSTTTNSAAAAPVAQLPFQSPSQIAEHLPANPALVSATPLVGTWTNVDHSTSDLVKVVITGAGASIKVNPYGACSPTPCNWGAEPAIAYAVNVSSTPAVGFTTTFKFSFAVVVVTGHLQGKQLIVETFTEFTDGSGRSNYYSSNTMAK
jgi:hypothetical protein